MDEIIAQQIFDEYSDKGIIVKDKLKIIFDLLNVDIKNGDLLKDIDKLDNNINFKDFLKLLRDHNKCNVTLNDIRNELSEKFNKNIVNFIINQVYPNKKDTDSVDPIKILESLPPIE